MAPANFCQPAVGAGFPSGTVGGTSICAPSFHETGISYIEHRANGVIEHTDPFSISVNHDMFIADNSKYNQRIITKYSLEGLNPVIPPWTPGYLSIVEGNADEGEHPMMGEPSRIRDRDMTFGEWAAFVEKAQKGLTLNSRKGFFVYAWVDRSTMEGFDVKYTSNRGHEVILPNDKKTPRRVTEMARQAFDGVKSDFADRLNRISNLNSTEISTQISTQINTRWNASLTYLNEQCVARAETYVGRILCKGVLNPVVSGAILTGTGGLVVLSMLLGPKDGLIVFSTFGSTLYTFAVKPTIDTAGTVASETAKIATNIAVNQGSQIVRITYGKILTLINSLGITYQQTKDKWGYRPVKFSIPTPAAVGGNQGNSNSSYGTASQGSTYGTASQGSTYGTASQGSTYGSASQGSTYGSVIQGSNSSSSYETAKEMSAQIYNQYFSVVARDEDTKHQYRLGGVKLDIIPISSPHCRSQKLLACLNNCYKTI